MPRSLKISAILAALGLAVSISPGQRNMARADVPPNPLRPSLASSTLNSPEPTPAYPRSRPLALQVSSEGAATEPPSVVPPQFGQPEFLPPPTGAIPAPADQFGGLEFSPVPPLQALIHPWFDDPWFSHGDPNDPHRHIGIGQPLIGTSWRNRPLYFGTFVGGVLMDDIVRNRIYQNDTTFVGARLGYDFDHFWGLEGRWAFARPDLANGSGTPFFPASRDNFADVSLLYYPLGDARWRPYLLAGLGFTTLRFNNDLGQRISEAVVDVPLGFGLKYFYGPWFTLRFDFTDNLALGNARISGMHNVSLMAGAEFRFGGRRPSYFPWHNNTAYW